MRKRLIVLIATVALLLVGAVPVSAAPGGVPGPPPDRGKSGEVVKGEVESPDAGEKKNGPPEWAKAYGKRIKDEYGVPYGHLQQCIRAVDGDAAADGDEVAAGDEVSENGEEGVKKALEACEELSDTHPEIFEELPEDSGAKAFWIFVNPEEGPAILGL